MGFLNIVGKSWALVPDTSQWQGVLDFDTFEDQSYYGYFFGEHRIVIVKATEGNGFVDPTYVANAARARAHDFLHVAYHFSRPDRRASDAALEAQHVVNTARPQGARCVMLDFEDTPLSGAELGAWRKAFLDELFRLWPDAPHGLYTGAYLRGTDGAPIPLAGLDPASVWLCIANYPLGYTADPDPTKFTRLPPLAPGFTHLALWQYTSSAHVAGIGGTSVDMSIATAEWVALIEGQAQGDDEMGYQQWTDEDKAALLGDVLRTVSGWSTAQGMPWTQEPDGRKYLTLDQLPQKVDVLSVGVNVVTLVAAAIAEQAGHPLDPEALAAALAPKLADEFAARLAS